MLKGEIKKPWKLMAGNYVAEYQGGMYHHVHCDDSTDYYMHYILRFHMLPLYLNVGIEGARKLIEANTNTH